MAGITDFLTPEAMRKIEALAIRSRYVVEGFRAGMHASPLKGASIEFADHRQYAKGDNLRSIDWKVFGRTERHYIKRYEEETSLRVQVIIDISGFDGLRLARPADEVPVRLPRGGLAGVPHHQAAGRRRPHALRRQDPRTGALAQRLASSAADRRAARLRTHPRGRTNTGEALHALAEILSRRGLIVILSDLFDDAHAVFQAIAHFRKKLHDVILLQILDPWELDLPMNRLAEFIDMETGEKLELDPALARAAYKAELQKDIDVTRERCATMNVDYRLVSTAQPYDDFIQQYLADRRRMSL